MRRLHRRICLLRATGRIAEAADLEQAEFSPALAAARASSSPAVDETSLLAEEAERVSAACLFAELVAPLLAERLHADPPPFATANSSPTIDHAKPRAAVAPVRRPAVLAPGIAELIDGMLSQEHGYSASRAQS